MRVDNPTNKISVYTHGHFYKKYINVFYIEIYSVYKTVDVGKPIVNTIQLYRIDPLILYQVFGTKRSTYKRFE